MRILSRFILLFGGGLSSASGSEGGGGTGTGAMDFSLAGGDNTALLALLEDI